MKEFVSGHGGELSGIRLQRGPAQFDSGGVRMLHAAIAAILREMKQEEVVLERTVLHPGGFGMHDFSERVGEAREIGEVRSGMNHDAIVAAILGESRFLKLAEFDGRVDESVIVWGLELILVFWERGGHAPAVGDG